MKKAVLTNLAPKPAGPYSQAIVANGFVFVAGQIPNDPATGKIESDDLAAQTERTLENVKAILEAAGSSLDKLVKVNVYLTDIRDFKAMNEVYARYIKGDAPPVRTTIEMGACRDARKIEIDCVALA